MKQSPFAQKLAQYVPGPAVQMVEKLLVNYPVLVKVSRPRKTKLGDYRPMHNGQKHRITINGDLNPYAFLITLLHEIAHMHTWVVWKHKVKPHGQEWKSAYVEILEPFVKLNIFPEDVQAALLRYVQNPKATSCTDLKLMKALRRYDETPPDHVVLDDLPVNGVFEWRDGRLFRKERQLRKRYRCLELRSGKYYLFNPAAEVKWMKQK